MDALTYYLKANLVFSVLFAVYLVALGRETWFVARRAWLLIAAGLSVLLPLLPSITPGPDLPTIELPAVQATPIGDTTTSIGWMGIILYAHLGISIVLLARLVLRCVRAVVTVRRAAGGPASFFHLVSVLEKDGGNDQVTLLLHERVHVEHGHSFDVIVFEILIAFFWSNPLWRMALRELRLVHEHAADAVARRSHADYEGLLLAHALGAPNTSLLNTFGSSNLKKRLVMLYNTRSPRLARRKLFFALPALLLALLLVSWQAVPLTDHGLRSLRTLTRVGDGQQPEFPGGMEALGRYLTENLRYPQAAIADKAEGSVYVSFLVMADGTVADVGVMRGVRPDLDAEAVRVVKAMPKWKPGMNAGKPAEARFTLPVSFRLGAGK